MPTCDAPGATVLKNTKSPARSASRDTRTPAVVLLTRQTRHLAAVARQDEVDEPAAVEARRRGAAVAIRGPTELERGGGDAMSEGLVGRQG